MKKAKRSPLRGMGLLGLGLLLLIGAVPVGAAAVSRLVEEWAPGRWPTAEATMGRSSITALGKRDKLDRMIDGKYIPKVEYDFDVDGKSYHSNRLSVREPIYNDLESAQSVALKYELGTKHTVFYDPADPSRAVLETGVTTATRWLMLAPFALAGFGAIFLWSWNVYRRQPKHRAISEFDI